MEHYIMQLSIIYNHTRNTYPPKEFTAAFKAYTKKYGVEVVAQKLELSTHTVNQLNWGKYIPSVRTLSKIKKLFDVENEIECKKDSILESNLMDIVSGDGVAGGDAHLMQEGGLE
jgi:DNA-binding XRE family transcriptional regulator